MGIAQVARAGARIAGVTVLLGLLVTIMVGSQSPLEGGTPAPAVENARRMDGKVGTLSMKQGRPLVVNIWATWCPPCLQEMPELAGSPHAIKASWASTVSRWTASVKTWCASWSA